MRPTADVTVTITRTGDTDLKVDTDANTPGFQNTLTFTPAKYHAPQSVVLTADDDEDAADGAAVFTHTASGGGYNNVTATMSATEADDDGALILSASNVTVTEGGTATYTVVLDAEPGGDVTVTVARNAGGDGDLTADTDPNTTGDQNTLTFTTTDWDTAQTVTLAAKQDDDGLPGIATFTNTASGGGYDGESATLTAIEKDDDAALNLTPTSVTVQEGGQAAYTVVLSHRPTATVTVTVARASGDANLTVRVGSSLTFKTSDWNVPQTVVIAAGEDGDALNGTAVFAHTATGGGFSGITAQLTATEADNERGIVFSPTSVTVPEGGSQTYTVKLESRPAGSVTVTVARTSGDGSLTADTDSNQTGDQNTLTFTTTDWSTAQTVTLTAAQDNDNANDEAVFTHTATGGGYGGVSAALTATEADDELGFKFSKLRVTVKESDPGLEACTASNPSYTVKLSSQPSTCDVVVTVYKQTTCTTCDDDIKIDTNLETTGDQNTLTFTHGSNGNWDTAQPVCLAALGDADGIDGTAEITHWANQSCLGTFDGVNAKVTATEADKNRYLISTSGTTGEVPEGDGKTWTVKLGSQPTADVTVTVTRELGGDPAIIVDTDPTDTDVDTTMTFTPTTWNTPQSFKVSAIEDDDAEHETVKFSFVPDGGGYGSGDAYDVTFRTRDNDELCPKGEVTAAACPDLFADISAESLYVPEGGTASITVRLTARPSTDQTVTIAEVFSFPGYYNTDTTVDTDPSTAGNQNTLTFTSANWSIPQTVTFATEEDNDETHYRETFTFTMPSYDSANLYVTESDNDIVVLEDLSDPARNELTVPEDGEASFKVKLSAAPASTLTVKVVRRTGAAHDVDLTVKSGASLTFTTTDWDTAQTVTLQADDDSDSRHGTAAFDLEGTYALHNYLTDFHVGALATVTAKEQDDDFQVTLSKTKAAVPEGGTATYTVVLGTQPAANVSVVVARKSGGDADLAADTDPDTAGDQDTLTFTTTNYDTPQTVTLRANDDEDDENGSAVFTHTATGGGYLQQVVEELTATEADDDRLVLEPTEVTVPEGGTATYTVALAEQPTGDVTVTVARASGDGDLTVSDTDPDTPGDQDTLTFTTTDHGTPQTVTLRANDDDDDENGSAVFTHTATIGGKVDAIATLKATEADDDEPAPSAPPPSGAPSYKLTLSATAVTVPEGGTASYTVALGASPTGTVTVAVARESGDADLTAEPATLTFTAANWSTPQTVTVSAADDADAVNGSAVFAHTAAGGGYAGAVATLTATEADDDHRLTLSAAAVTVPEGGTASYTVALGTAPTGTVTVAVARESGDADLTAEPATLTFTAANWSTPQTVTVRAADDADAVDGEAVFAHTAAGGGYTGAVATLTATEEDDDYRLTLSAAAVTVPEGGTADYTVALGTRPDANVTVAVARESGDADLTADPATLTFTAANWSTPQTVTVRAADDADAVNGSAVFAHTATGGGYDGQAVATLTATEEDDDRLKLAPSAVTVPEGGTASYTVVLGAPPTGAVTVAVARESGDADLTADPATLTFTAANWSTPQTVTVSAADDADAVDGAAAFAHTAAGGGYDGAAATLTATEADDEGAAAGAGERIAAVNQTILPQVLQAAVQTTVTNVAARMAWRFSETAPVATRPVDTVSLLLAETLAAHGESLEDGTFAWRDAVAASDFAMALYAAGDGDDEAAATGAGGVALWGAGEYVRLRGSEDSLDWEGGLFSAHLGVETLLGPRFIAGLGVTREEGSFDYDYDDGTHDGPSSGTQKLRLTSVYPYAGRGLDDDGSSIWAAVGYGEGEVEVDDGATGERQAADARQRMAAGGGTVRLDSTGGVLFEAGSAALDLKGEAWLGRTEVDDNGDLIRGLTVSTWGLRVALRGREAVRLDSGAALAPSLELGMRADGGDGISGAGLEVGAGVGWTDPSLGLTLRLKSRAVAAHQEDYGEWGVAGAFRLDPGGDGRGFSLSLNQSWGRPDSGVEELWESRAAERRNTGGGAVEPRFGGEVGYGVAGPRSLGGSVTFYSGLDLSADGRLYLLGARFRRAPGLSSSIEGTHGETTGAAADSGLFLRFRLTW